MELHTPTIRIVTTYLYGGGALSFLSQGFPVRGQIDLPFPAHVPTVSSRSVRVH